MQFKRIVVTIDPVSQSIEGFEELFKQLEFDQMTPLIKPDQRKRISYIVPESHAEVWLVKRMLLESARKFDLIDLDQYQQQVDKLRKLPHTNWRVIFNILFTASQLQSFLKIVEQLNPQIELELIDVDALIKQLQFELSIVADEYPAKVVQAVKERIEQIANELKNVKLWATGFGFASRVEAGEFEHAVLFELMKHYRLADLKIPQSFYG